MIPHQVWWHDTCIHDNGVANRNAGVPVYLITALLQTAAQVLREVVKPEVLWFLRNPEEAIEHPLRDLIDEPVPKHARRIVSLLLA